MKNRLITLLILLVSTGSLLAAVSPLPPIWATVSAAVAMLGILWRMRRRLRRPEARLLGAHVPARIVLLAASMALFGHVEATPSLVIAMIALALMIPLTALEAMLGRTWRAGTRAVLHLPGVDADSSARRLGGLLVPAGLLVTLTGMLAVRAPVLCIVVAVLVVALYAVSGWATVAARLRQGRLNEQVRDAVASFAAPVMIYVSGPPGTEYQFGVWKDQFEGLAEKAVVVTREAGLARKIGEMTALPVISASRLPQLEALHEHPFSVCLYVNNGMKNSHNVRYGDRAHVQLLHGDSDKPSSYNPVTVMFDKVFVAGQAGIDRYASHGVVIPREKFEIVGRPQVADILPAAPSGDGAEVVLYAPTWTGFNTDNSFGSLHAGPEIVRELLEAGWTVIFRPHPYSAREPGEAAKIQEIHDLLGADAGRTGRSHRFGDAASRGMSIVDCFNASHALVADVSSVPADYLFSEKPFVITKVSEGSSTQFVDDFPLAAAAIVMDVDSASSIKESVARLRADDLATRRSEMRTYYLGDIPRDSYAEVFPDAVSDLVEAYRGKQVTSTESEWRAT